MIKVFADLDRVVLNFGPHTGERYLEYSEAKELFHKLDSAIKSMDRYKERKDIEDRKEQLDTTGEASNDGKAKDDLE